MSSFICQKSKRILLIFLTLIFAIVSIIFLFVLKPKLSFREMTDQMFFEDITQDTLSLHYTLAYPSRYSIDSYSVMLPRYSKDNLIQSKSKIENYYSVLSHMDNSTLSKEDAYCHNLLQDYFLLEMQGFPFTYYEECFSPSSGIVSNFPILMAEYTFRTPKDVSDYLILLKDTPNYFSTYVIFQKERSKEGHYLASASLKETIKQCDTILTKESLENDSHFLQLTFRERLAPLVAKDLISKKQAFQYIEENNNILKNIVWPAYQGLKKALQSLEKEDQPLQGLYRKEKGKEYYQWLVKKQVGHSVSIPEILEKLETDFEKNLYKFHYFQEKIQAFSNYERYLEEPFPLTDKNEMIKVLQKMIRKDFPPLSAFSDRPIKTTLKFVSSCMEEYTSPAFYLLPPIDDIWQNTIYINNRSTPQGLDLFTTLAHEGYPGHLYQTVYYQLYSKEKDVPLIRHIMNYEGYVEGWALYCEFMAYDYVTNLYPVKQQEFYSLWHQLLLADRKLQLAILSILDIKLHFYDDSLDTAKNILNQYGISEEETIADIYRYILEEPGNYLKYYMGYLLLTELKEKAKIAMGSDYTDLKFHEFILNSGPSDYNNLERRLLQEW